MEQSHFMDEHTYITEISVLAPETFSVLDAAVGRWLALEFLTYSDVGNLGTRWLATSSGSSHHTLIHNGDALWHINLRAFDLHHTVIQLVVLQESYEDDLKGQLRVFWDWFKAQQEIKLPLIDEEHIP